MPAWYPATYDLATEVHFFVKHYREVRKAEAALSILQCFAASIRGFQLSTDRQARHACCNPQQSLGHIVLNRSDALQVAEAGGDNHWVVKLAEGSRSTDLCLTDSEGMVVHLRRAPGGDRVAQKYIPRPVLYMGRKFDLRVPSLTSPRMPAMPLTSLS